jgi:stress response protein SCP2
MVPQTLTKGGNAPVPDGEIRVVARWRRAAGTPELDLTGLLLGESGKVRSDADMVFYNQPRHPSGAATLETAPDSGTLRVALPAVPADVAKILLAVSVHDATLDGVTDLHLTVEDAGGAAALRFDVTDTAGLAAVVLGELYRRGGAWKLRAVGQGWSAGLEGLAAAYGITVDAPEPPEPPESPAPPAAAPAAPMAPPAPPAAPMAPAAPPAPPMAPAAPMAPPAAPPPAFAANQPPPAAPAHDATAAQEERLPVDMRKRLSMRKQIVNVVLTKKGLTGIQARVILVLDASGSMTGLYGDGTVARVVERIAAVGARLTPDGVLPAWIFASNTAQLPHLTIGELPRWIKKHVREGQMKLMPRSRPLYRSDGTVDMREIGIQNEEQKVMADIIRVVSGLPPGPPAFVLFFSDGGIYRDKEIEDILRDAAALPIFWQFIGLGNADYGVLETLDTLAGRVVDNAGFFAVDDIDRIGDEELYERLLTEFPLWLTAARTAGVLQ